MHRQHSRKVPTSGASDDASTGPRRRVETRPRAWTANASAAPGRLHEGQKFLALRAMLREVRLERGVQVACVDPDVARRFARACHGGHAYPTSVVATWSQLSAGEVDELLARLAEAGFLERQVRQWDFVNTPATASPASGPTLTGLLLPARQPWSSRRTVADSSDPDQSLPDRGAGGDGGLARTPPPVAHTLSSAGRGPPFRAR